jgi:hypothetical protein
MLTRLIVNLYAWIIEIYLWLMLLISAIAGYHFVVPVLRAAGLIFEHEGAGRIAGALLGAAVGFLVLAVAAGPILVLVDIRRLVKALEARRGGDSVEVLRTERVEPGLWEGPKLGA